MSQNTAKILGIHIASTRLSEVLNEAILAVEQDRRIIIFTPNPEFLVEAKKDKKFQELLNKADINLPDGIGLVWAGKLLGQPVAGRVSGADVVERLLEMGNELCVVGCESGVGSGGEDKGRDKRWMVGIAGARRGVQDEAEELVKRLQKKYPSLIFVNLDDPKFQILNFKFQIVLACHGMKKQEEWIWENKDKIKANVFMGVGGSMDFLAGFSRRAPALMRRAGLEWLWRGLQKPKHFKRVWKAVFVFGWLVFKEKFVPTSSPLRG